MSHPASRNKSPANREPDTNKDRAAGFFLVPLTPCAILPRSLRRNFGAIWIAMHTARTWHGRRWARSNCAGRVTCLSVERDSNQMFAGPAPPALLTEFESEKTPKP